MGGTVCSMHGGRAPQVRAKAAARWALVEMAPPSLEHVDPALVMGDGVALGRQVLAHITGTVLAGETPTVAQLDALGVWLDRVQRLAKTASDAGVSERRVRVAEAQLLLMDGAIRAVVRALGHDPADPSVAKVIEGELRALDAAEGQS